MQKRLKGIKMTAIILSGCLLFTACGGPSEEKIAQAQAAYTELVETHNQVVAAHKEIADTSLDAGLQTLADKLEQVDDFALNEMEEEDIDFLIETMNTIKGSYEEYLTKIETIKKAEDAAVLIPVSFSLVNSTEQIFTKLVLYPSNDKTQKLDVLQGTLSFEPKQSLTGLTINKDVTATPWVMEIENVEGTSYQLDLNVKDFAESGEVLTLTFNEETGEVSF